MYSLEQFCNVIKGKLIQRGDCNNICHINIYPLEMFSADTFVAVDSRKYSTTDGGFGNTGNEDSVFGLKGTQNTYNYIPSAINSGAKTIVFDNTDLLPVLEFGVNYILVDDSISALAFIAKDILNHSKAKIIGVSGSTGKTTLSKCLENYISEREKVFCLDCIRITYLGLVWAIIHEFDDSFDWILLEMQTDGKGQLDRICEIATLDYAFLINIRDSHLERFGSIENLIYEKTALYRGLSNDGYLFVNSDDENLSSWLSKQNDERIISVGKKTENDFILSYDNKATNGSFCISNQLNNTFHSVNVVSYGDKELYCTGMLYAFSFIEYKQDDIHLIDFKCLSNCVGRFQEYIGKNNSKVIVDSYNASYLSVISGIEKISQLKIDKKILVLGSLLELSDKSETIHKEIGKYLNSINCFDYILFIGEATLYTMNELRNNEKVIAGHVYSYERAMSLLNLIPIDENTVLYFKGSGAMRLELLAINYIGC